MTNKYKILSCHGELLPKSIALVVGVSLQNVYSVTSAYRFSNRKNLNLKYPYRKWKNKQ